MLGQEVEVEGGGHLLDRERLPDAIFELHNGIPCQKSDGDVQTDLPTVGELQIQLTVIIFRVPTQIVAILFQINSRPHLLQIDLLNTRQLFQIVHNLQDNCRIMLLFYPTYKDVQNCGRFELELKDEPDRLVRVQLLVVGNGWLEG